MYIKAAMADDGVLVVVDEERKIIVTKFLLSTRRLRQRSNVVQQADISTSGRQRRDHGRRDAADNRECC